MTEISKEQLKAATEASLTWNTPGISEAERHNQACIFKKVADELPTTDAKAELIKEVVEEMRNRRKTDLSDQPVTHFDFGYPISGILPSEGVWALGLNSGPRAADGVLYRVFAKDNHSSIDRLYEQVDHGRSDKSANFGAVVHEQPADCSPLVFSPLVF